MHDIAGPGTRAVSVAPPPDTNRSALSQAWYSALYGTERNTARRHVAADVPAAQPAGIAPARGAIAPQHAPVIAARVAAGVAFRSRPALEAATVERVRSDRSAPQSPAARSWRAALARRTLCRFTLPDGARIDVLLQQRGKRLHAVAVSGNRAGSSVDRLAATALLRARAALLAHGIRLATTHTLKGSA